jgi:hypothetical protein
MASARLGLGIAFGGGSKRADLETARPPPDALFAWNCWRWVGHLR